MSSTQINFAVLLLLTFIPGHFAGRRRVISVGDLHGDYDHAIDILQAARLIDVGEGSSSRDSSFPVTVTKEAGTFSLFSPNAVRWVGGNATLVQTGDIVDRGAYAKDLYALFMHIRAQAAAEGGEVINLLGNHEVMNLQGQLHYVSPQDVAQFGSEKIRKEAFSPLGWIGRDIRSNYKIAAVVEGTLFVHAGLTPEHASLGLDALNQAAREALDIRGESIVNNARGPLWVRHLALAQEQDACPWLEATLASMNARRMVVGHTQVDTGRVKSRCGGRLLLADTVISKNGYPSCWRPGSYCQASASFVEYQSSGAAKAVCTTCNPCLTETFEPLPLLSDTVEI